MEQYSPKLAEWIAKQLAQVDLKTFRQLYAYYQQRGGPGWELAQQEAAARHLTSQTTQP